MEVKVGLEERGYATSPVPVIFLHKGGMAGGEEVPLPLSKGGQTSSWLSPGECQATVWVVSL